MKPWLLFLYGLAFGILASGLFFLLITPPRGESVTLIPSPTQAPYRVDISGQINHPGVYSLPKGGRWEDVVHLAGGLTNDADIDSINMARKIYDGEKIFIPAIGQATWPNFSLSSPDSTPGNPININSASKEQLDSLPGIGPKISEAIIEYRNEHGSFSTCEELKNVAGIGDEIYNKISSMITVR